ncbi:hypothetical protein BCR36DRAFT_278695 [Piromyces finnis]|uniref:TPR-like protein n=1 Tax=Piromyces finnis TaxID=1754191 RepID=A0A1Y1VID8_9FUNG|nr:hypothetical protein BCR36DRAFT_278695 [Piromyces finnis]|eukprot:ORX57167.1 hypothetical protein BCR36DRAFT_278695 [Piromyces finnis]
MTQWMLELPHFRLSSDGSLTIAQKDDNLIDLETILPSGDIESIVVAQFDKLNSDYQEFLRVASVVGQFKVIDIKNFISTQYKKDYNFLNSGSDEILNDENESPEALFKSLDKYGFLKLIYQDSDEWLESTYAFSSDMIQKAIYTLNTFSKREEIHLYFAHFFEQEFISNPERQDLLVSIYDHYSHSPDKQKTKVYLEKVCKYYFKLKSMQEAIKYYRILFKLFRYEQYSTELTAVSNWTLSEWHKQIGEAYLAIQKYKEAENHIIISLRLMDVQIPSGGFSLWWLLKKVNRHNNVLYQNNFESFSYKKKKEKKYKVVRGCLLLLSEIYNYLHKQNLFKLSIKMALMWSSKLKVDIKYILILSLYSMEYITSAIDEKRNFQVGICAMNKAKLYLENFDNTLSYDILLIHDSLAQCYFILGDWKNALSHWDYLISQSVKLNEMALWDKGVIMKAFTEFHSGNTEYCLKTSSEMLIKRKSWKNQCLAYACVFMNFLLQNEEEDMAPTLTIMKNLSELTEKMNTTNYSIQLVYYGIVGQVYYRFGVPLIENVQSGLVKIVKYLDRLGHPSWGALISFPHILDLLYFAYNNGVFMIDNHERTVCIGILLTLINTLEKYFVAYLISIPVLALARGLYHLISGEYELAIDTWKNGLIDKDEERISNIRLPYFTGRLYGLIKRFSIDPIEKEDASEKFNAISNIFSYSFGIIYDEPIESRHTCIVLNDNVKNQVFQELLNKSVVQIQNNSRSINYITQQQNILSIDMKSNLMNENIHRGIPDRSNSGNLLQSIQRKQIITSNLTSASSINNPPRRNHAN